MTWTHATRFVACAILLVLATRGDAFGTPRANAKGGHQGQQIQLSDQGYFFAGGRYVEVANGQIMTGQMFVEYRIPKNRKYRYPIVMIHGGGQTGTNYLATPDGRDGWVDAFLRSGYAVYVVDHPARGRSAYHPDQDGPLSRLTTEFISSTFTNPAPGAWPTAHLHTQWPGTGMPGDPIFDQFYASQVELSGGTELLVRAAGADLLDRIGDAILVTHSQSGPFGWVIADERPTKVKGILALEPSGPPFTNAPPFGTGLSRPWGIASTPITYSPPVADPSELLTITETEPQGPGLVTCTLQQEPARQLPNLSAFPILIFRGEASYHAAYDHCTTQYLQQAGASVELVGLEEVGIRGNGHMVMLEKNNLEVADFMMDWLKRQGLNKPVNSRGRDDDDLDRDRDRNRGRNRR